MLLKTLTNIATGAKYCKAKELAGCLYGFPYQSPAEVPLSIREDLFIMSLITETHKTTIDLNGNRQQTTIDAAERMRLQAEFKVRIHSLLDECLAQIPDHGPALLLYPRVAEFNTRAAHRQALIELYERLLPRVEAITKGTNAYNLIKLDIEGLGGNYFDKVERHLADFHYELAKLYGSNNQIDSARIEYRKANKLCPKIYGIRTNRYRML